MAKHSSSRKPSSRAPRRLTERRIAGLTASEEVWRFAVAHDLIPHLETAVRLVRECFSTVQAIKFLYEVDWENENESYIVVQIGDIETARTPDAVLEQYNRFTVQMVKLVPPNKGDKILLSF